MLIEIYTDGACKGNPGPGGWGVLFRHITIITEQEQTNETMIYGSESHTTNNRMELTAAIKALEKLEDICGTVCNVTINLYTDSQYLRCGMTEWLAQWKRKGWHNSKREPVKNKDLWQRLDTLTNQYQVRWHWIKAHVGHPGNEQADALANKGIEELLCDKSY